MTNVTSLTIVALPMLKFDHDYQGCGHRAWVPDPWKSNWIGPLLNFTFNLSFILSIWIVRFSLGHPENFPLLIYHNYTLRSKKWGGGGVYWFHLVRLSICGQNRVHSVSSAILAGFILYLHILSSNFRRCVAWEILFLFFVFRNSKNWSFGKSFKLMTLFCFDLQGCNASG